MKLQFLEELVAKGLVQPPINRERSLPKHRIQSNGSISELVIAERISSLPNIDSRLGGSRFGADENCDSPD